MGADDDQRGPEGDDQQREGERAAEPRDGAPLGLG